MRLGFQLRPWIVVITCCAGFAAVSSATGCAEPVAGDDVVVVERAPELMPVPDWEEYRRAAQVAGGDSGFFVVEGDLVIRSKLCGFDLTLYSGTPSEDEYALFLARSLG